MAGTNGGNALEAPANGSGSLDDPNAAPLDGNNPNNPNEPASSDALTLEQARALRSENQRRNKENRELTDKLKKIEDAQKTELEKTSETAASEKARANALEAQLKEISLNKAITAAVSDTALYPDLLVEKLGKQDILDDATGLPDAKKLEKALVSLRKLYPALFKSSDQGGDAGANGKTGGSGGMDAMIRASMGRK